MHRNSQFMERLFTVIMTGAYGLVMVWMFAADYFGWNRGERSIISLVTQWIQFTILIGGVFLLVLSIILLWNIKSASDGHHHSHDPEDHDHDCCDHDHDHEHHHHHDHKHEHGKEEGHDHHHHEGHECCDHGHDHGWNPIRYIPLLVPLILIFMGLPDAQMIQNFEKYRMESALKGQKVEVAPDESLCWGMLSAFTLPGEVFAHVTFTTAIISGFNSVFNEMDDDAKGVQPVVTDLAQLDKVLLDPGLRQQFERYRKVELDGMFSLDEVGAVTMFRVVRLRMACCLTDSRPAMILCFTKKKLSEQLQETTGKSVGTKWVKVQGRLKFGRTPEGKYQAILKASSIEVVPTPPFPYLN